MTVKNISKLAIKWFLFVLFFAGAISSAISAIWTLIPDSSASKECMLGYLAHCSFTPISTMILFFIIILFIYILVRTNYLKSLD
jgi:hypothetical protein